MDEWVTPLILVGVVVTYFALMRWVLPRFGVPT